jgi:hypothetical protein
MADRVGPHPRIHLENNILFAAGDRRGTGLVLRFHESACVRSSKADSEKDGAPAKEMKSTLLRATDYSPIR